MGEGWGKGLKSIEGVRPPADRSRAPRRGCACATPRAYGRRAGGASHEEEIPGIRHGVVRERNDLVVAIAGVDLPLVGAADLGEGRALRLGAEAAEHQDIPLA